jgi:hypothetical protein
MRYAIISMVAVVLVGCATSGPSVTRGALSDVHSVAVAPFESGDESVSEWVASKVAERLARIEGLRVTVGSAGEVEAVIAGDVDATERRLRDRPGETVVIEHSVILRATVVRAGESEPAWRGTATGSSEDFFRALEIAAVSLAERISVLFESD